MNDHDPSSEPDPKAAAARAHASNRPSIRRLLNATGVVVDPKFGGPPLPVAAQRAIADVGAGYSTPGHELTLGAWDVQGSGVERWLTLLTGAEAALVVNSSPGAVLLVLSSLAAGQKVLVPRGELAEVGRALRLSEVMERSRARLVEVGTSQKTRLVDFERALQKYSGVGAILRLPISGVAIEGLAEGGGVSALAQLARAHQVPLIEDLGNGALVNLAPYGLERRHIASESLSSGADVVTCSGSLLLGGLQVGFVLGAAKWIERMRRDPLLRALRLDRLVLAALDAMLALHADPDRARQEIPALAMLSLPDALLHERAERLAAELGSRVPGLSAKLVAGAGERAGGALPNARLAGPLVELEHDRLDAGELDRHARTAQPPVIGIVRQERFLLDPRTLAEREIAMVATTLAAAWNEPGGG